MVSTSKNRIALHNTVRQKAELPDKFYAIQKHQDNFTTKRKHIFQQVILNPTGNQSSEFQKPRYQKDHVPWVPITPSLSAILRWSCCILTENTCLCINVYTSNYQMQFLSRNKGSNFSLYRQIEENTNNFLMYATTLRTFLKKIIKISQFAPILKAICWNYYVFMGKILNL